MDPKFAADSASSYPGDPQLSEMLVSTNCDSHPNKSVDEYDNVALSAKILPADYISHASEISVSSLKISVLRSTSEKYVVRKPPRPKTLVPIKCIKARDFRPAKYSTMCLLNTRSIKNKAPFIKDFIVDNDIEFLGINETWLDSGDGHKHVVKDVVPTGYKMHHVPRSGRGGGNAIIYKSALDIKSQTTMVFRSFEYMECLLRSDGHWLRIIVLYRPSPSQHNKLTITIF